MQKKTLKKHNCRNDRDFFNQILQDYFSGKTAECTSKMQLIPKAKIDLFWAYANSRLIKREDSIAISSMLSESL